MNETDLAHRIIDRAIFLSVPRTNDQFILEAKASYHCHAFAIPSMLKKIEVPFSPSNAPSWARFWSNPAYAKFLSWHRSFR